MSFTIKYTGTKQEKYAKAYQDGMDYLTAYQKKAVEDYAVFAKSVQPGRIQAYRDLKIALAFAGVRGLPARVIAFKNIFGHMPK